MCLIFKMQLLAYLLSLSASLETGINFLKTNTTLLDSSLGVNPLPKENLTSKSTDIEKIKSELSKSQFIDIDNGSMDGLRRTRSRKSQDLGLERTKNRTRKQKEVVNATLEYSANKDDRKITLSSEIYDSKNSKHNDMFPAFSKKISKQKVNETNSNQWEVKSTVLSKTLRGSSRVTRRPMTSRTTKTTKSPVHKKNKSGKEKNKEAGPEGRSKNRIQRNRHKKPSISKRRRYRYRFTSRHESNEKIKSDSSRNTSRENKPRRIDTSLNQTVESSGPNVTDPPSNKDSTSAEAKDCPTCRRKGLSEDTVRQIRLDMFIKTMADKLRMTTNELMTRPNRRTAPKFPRELLEETLQDNAMKRKSDQFYAKDQQVILSGQDLGRNCIAKRTSGCYSFDLAGNVRGDVASAELWFYKTPDRNDSSVQTFLLYGLEKLSSGRVLAQNQIQRQDTYVREGWVVINLTRTVTSWVHERKTTEMIAIRCATCVTRKHKALYGTKHGYKPLIIIKYDKTSLQSRDKRSYDNCDPEIDCCKRSLEVNFRDIHMYSVEAPPDLSVGYCYGRCNNILAPYTHNHTMIKQMVRSQSDDVSEDLRQKLEPCCVPIAFKSTLLMLSSSRGGIVTSMPNIIVEECGCV